jgi:hypothetical protein
MSLTFKSVNWLYSWLNNLTYFEKTLIWKRTVICSKGTSTDGRFNDTFMGTG